MTVPIYEILVTFSLLQGADTVVHCDMIQDSSKTHEKQYCSCKYFQVQNDHNVRCNN